MNKPLGVICSAILAAGLVGSPRIASATVVSLGNVISNGTFGLPLTSGWTSSGIANVRRTTDAINLPIDRDGGGSATFDGFFSSRFAVLGDTAGFISPTDSALEAEGTHSLSQSFVLGSSLDQGDVLDYRLSIFFRTAFDGRDSRGARPNDVFSALLAGPGGDVLLFSQTSQGLGTCGPSVFPNCTDAQKTIDRSSGKPLVLDALLPGAYTLTFSLYEAAGGAFNDTRNSQTAAGIDDVRVVASARVPEPAGIALMASGVLGLIGSRLRRRTA